MKLILVKLLLVSSLLILFSGCETKEKIDNISERLDKQEKIIQKQQEIIHSYEQRKEETTSYIKYIIGILFIIYIVKIILSKSSKLIKRG